MIALITRDVLKHYKAHSRSYHGAAHPYNQYIALKLLLQKHQNLSGVNVSALIFMIVFHDAIMKHGMGADWNERQSAEYASNVLSSLGAPQELESLVWAGVYATYDHSLKEVPAHMHATVGLMLDFDLMGLGGSSESFAADTESIWLEYQTRYSREEYDTGRKAWAAEFLTRERVYHTPYYQQLEIQALRNLSTLVEG